MLQLKVGVQLSTLRQPFKKALHIAAQLGADAVEIDARGQLRPADLTRTGVRQVRKMLEDLNLRVCAVSFRTRRGYNVAEDLDRRIEATKAAMSMAFDLGARAVVNHIGRVPDEAQGPDWDLLVAALSDIGRHGQRVGVTLAAKTGSEDSARLAELLQALPTGALAINLDPGGLIVNGFSAADAARLLGPNVIHVHAKDGVRDLAQGRGIEVPLGRGSAELPEIMAILEEHAYQGYFTVERENAADPVLEVEQAVAYLRNVIQ